MSRSAIILERQLRVSDAEREETLAIFGALTEAGDIAEAAVVTQLVRAGRLPSTLLWHFTFAYRTTGGYCFGPIRTSVPPKWLGSPLHCLNRRSLGDTGALTKLERRVVYRRKDLELWLEARIARGTSDAGARLPKSLIVQGRGSVVDRTNNVGRGKQAHRTLVPASEEHAVVASEIGGARKQ